MVESFARATLARLPLAEAVLSLTAWVFADQPLDDTYEENRGRAYTRLLAFNVWEWCHDIWEDGDSARVPRGGSWSYFGEFCRTASRRWSAPSNRGSGLGFRLARGFVR